MERVTGLAPRFLFTKVPHPFFGGGWGTLVKSPLEKVNFTKIIYWLSISYKDKRCVFRLFQVDSVNKCKALMILSLKDYGNTERLEVGVTYLYVYRSVDGRVLYNIHIDSANL